MTRTKTSHLSSITLSLPAAGYLNFETPPNPSARTTAIIPSGSVFDSDLHWHEQHDEFFQASQGALKITLEDSAGVLQNFFIGANSGVVEIKRNRRHRIRRADEGKNDWREGMVYRDGGKIEREEWEGDVHAQGIS
jgi:oxalate decarboxylase/phosphoglucose isomerase-like protein (cupin superfamily)